MASKCFIRCLQKRHPDILLPNNQKIVLGRGPTTKIKEKRCSREQVQLMAKYQDFSIQVEQLGSNPSCINGQDLEKGARREIVHGEEIELLKGEFKYQVIFDPKPSQKLAESEKAPTKRKTMDQAELLIQGQTETKRTKSSLNLFKTDYRVKELDSSGGFHWEEIERGEVYVMTSKDCAPNSKIAAFDMDGTLITTQSGRVFAKDLNDWRILLPEVPGRLKKLHTEGFKIVILTNQRGIATGKVKFPDFKTKVERIADKIRVPLQLFCCSGDGGMFRKPRIGVWKLLEMSKNGGLPIDMEQSFYCGDAAGRNVGWVTGKKKDFSCSDRLFALNLGLKFHTPEEFFLGHKPTSKFALPEFDPQSVDVNAPLLDPESSPLKSKSQEVILLVGVQGSGKSFLAETIYEPDGYIVASNDRSGGRDRTLKAVDAALTSGQSVVVDNTHAERETRAKFVDVAKKHGVPVRCFVMKSSFQQSRHNNLFRELIGSDHVKIKEPLLHAFKARYQEPQLDEGYQAIAKVNFVPKFSNKDEETLYRMYLQEK
eukprot:maker-scaffold726_size105808-snap-gene-0.22 protein:Tk01907 transcript:maker-scaffold726_size105808-snap-gene-0.22-mRNA-1 annotation:"bifunctional polynucleotide phosphatase kinase"